MIILAQVSADASVLLQTQESASLDAGVLPPTQEAASAVGPARSEKAAMSNLKIAPESQQQRAPSSLQP